MKKYSILIIAAVFVLAIMGFVSCRDEPSAKPGQSTPTIKDDDAFNLTGRITAPVFLNVPQTTFQTEWYNASIAWSEAGSTYQNITFFGSNKTYKAVVTLTPKQGFTFGKI